MSNRLPCDDVQVDVPVTVQVNNLNKNTMKKTLAKIEHLNSLLKDYEGNVHIEIEVPTKELKQFAKQENKNLFTPSSITNYYWIRFTDEKVEVTLRSKYLKPSKVVWE